MSAARPASLDAMEYLSAKDLFALTRTPLRTIRHRMAAWERAGWPRVVRVPRAVGGVERLVVAADYERLTRGERPAAPRAA